MLHLLLCNLLVLAFCTQKLYFVQKGGDYLGGLLDPKKTKNLVNL